MSDILFETRGAVGLVILNRPKALNALNLEMVTAMTEQMAAWLHDDAIAAVIVTSNSEKSFCAGGDIRKVWEERGNPPYDFFWHEYRLNRFIHRYPKPYISLINGIVMGGGVGLSMHGRYVVLGEKTTFAMPETGIGFFPDVGGSYVLPRMKGQTGTYCGLSAARLKQADCFALGLATHMISGSRFDEIIERIADGETIDAVLDPYHEDKAPNLSDQHLALIDEVFSHGTVGEILTALEASEDPFAAETLSMIRAKSPTSVHITLGQIRRGAKLDFEECMQLDWRILKRILKDDDFYEGVRATLVDKDGAPNWNPDTFESVDPARVDAHFAPLGDEELKFDNP